MATALINGIVVTGSVKEIVELINMYSTTIEPAKLYPDISGIDLGLDSPEASKEQE